MSNNSKNKLKIWIIPAVIGLLIAFFVKTFVVSIERVNGSEMAPTIDNGQLVFVWKGGQNVSRGTVISYHVDKTISDNTNIDVVASRVIGVPGDRVTYTDNKLRVNGKVVSDWYITPSQASDTGMGIDTGWSIMSLSRNLNWPMKFQKSKIVPGNAYFVLNDNRLNSIDSREYGFVTKDRIIGRVTSLPFNFDNAKEINNSGKKFFK